MQEQEPLIEAFARVPEELQAYPQWVNWRRDHDRKVPVNPSTLGNAGVHWPNTWASFDQAKTMTVRYRLGLGFVLTETDPYTCVDLDHCVGASGQTSDQTRAILDLLAGYVELSPSETGLHIWIKNGIPLNRRTPGLEIYSSARFATVTGWRNPHAPQEIPERTAELAELVRVYFREEEHRFVASPRTLDDEEIWQRLFTAQNGAFFESLFRGDTSVCYGDHSRGVIMLANMLAVMTNGDAVAIKRLLYQTGLANEKWEARRGQRTWIDYQIEDALRYVAGRKR